jgi:hypothetical protein
MRSSPAAPSPPSDQPFRTLQFGQVAAPFMPAIFRIRSKGASVNSRDGKGAGTRWRGSRVHEYSPSAVGAPEAPPCSRVSVRASTRARETRSSSQLGGGRGFSPRFLKSGWLAFPKTGGGKPGPHFARLCPLGPPRTVAELTELYDAT